MTEMRAVVIGASSGIGRELLGFSDERDTRSGLLPADGGADGVR